MKRPHKLQFRLTTRERLSLGRTALDHGISLSEMLRLLIAKYC